MSSKNVTEVLWVAIHVLVTSEGKIQERLASAAVGLISLPSENGLPKQFQQSLDLIAQDLTKEPAERAEGRIQATTGKMSNEEARNVAKQILSLYTALKGGYEKCP